MKLTRACSYALHALVYMSEHDPGGRRGLASQEIARERGLPERFLLKVLKPLVGAGILGSARGPGGGYLLARPLGEISLLDVVEAVEGPKYLLGGAPAIEQTEDVATRQLDEQLQAISVQLGEKFRDRLRDVSLARLAGSSSKSKA